jgi:hypothetical protein
MKNLRLWLIMILCLSSLFLCAGLYADELDRPDIRARESSTPQFRAEGAQEAWRSYEARVNEYEKMIQKEGIALEDYLKNNPATLERTESTSISSSAAVSVTNGNDGASTPLVSSGNDNQDAMSGTAGAITAPPVTNEAPPIVAEPEPITLTPPPPPSRGHAVSPD